MKFTIKKPQEHIANIMRKLGYRLLGRQHEDEWSFVKSLTGGLYPRFHAYITQKGDMLVMSLHVDQKKPSYKGATAHSGEYEGALVVEEAERIKRSL